VVRIGVVIEAPWTAGTVKYGRTGQCQLILYALTNKLNLFVKAYILSLFAQDYAGCTAGRAMFVRLERKIDTAGIACNMNASRPFVMPAVFLSYPKKSKEEKRHECTQRTCRAAS
jgi:hypothetical protein